jgi:hypothetical protein
MSSSKSVIWEGWGSKAWSEGEMSALLDKWGHLYQQRECLSVIKWRDVCAVVNPHRAIGHCFDRTVTVCQRRPYARKPMYKKEVDKG